MKKNSHVVFGEDTLVIDKGGSAFHRKGTKAIIISMDKKCAVVRIAKAIYENISLSSLKEVKSEKNAA